MMEKRLNDRIDHLKQAYNALTVAKEAVDAELSALTKQYKDMKRRIETTPIGDVKVLYLQRLVRQRGRELSSCKHDLQEFCKQNRILYDMASMLNIMEYWLKG